MTNSKKIYISIASFVALSALLAGFVIWPLILEIKASSQELRSTKNQLASLTLEEEQQEKAQGLYKNYQSDVQRMEKVFIDPDVPLEFITFLEKEAENSNLQLTISSITKSIQKQEPWPSLLIQMSTRGSFDNFLEFLAKLENSPYLIELSELTARKSVEREADDVVNLSVKVFTK